EPQREAEDPELRADAVGDVRPPLAVVAEEREIPIRLPARDADAAEDIDERQRVVAHGGYRQRSRVERRGGRAWSGRRNRTRRRERRIRVAEIDVVHLEPDRVERTDSADQLEAAAVVIDPIGGSGDAEIEIAGDVGNGGADVDAVVLRFGRTARGQRSEQDERFRRDTK